MNTLLVGKKQIAAFVQRSWDKTIRKWIVKDGFPARKIDGVWMSDSDLISIWIKEKLSSVDPSQKAVNDKR